MLNFKVKEFKSIVKEIEFKIYPKKISFIIGKNGLGKSNILDAIDWFANGSNNLNNNICSQSTSTSFIGKASVVLKYELNENRIIEIDKILSKYFDNFNKPKVFINYIEKNSDSASYNYLYQSNNNLTELAEIINRLLKLNEEKWLDKRFYRVSNKGTYTLTSDLTKEKLEKLEDMTDELRQKHIKLFEDIKKIENLYKEKPIVIYIRNADLENNTKFSYYIDEYSKKENNKGFMDLLRFLGPDVLNEINVLQELNSVDENRERQADKITSKIDKIANEKLKDLFNQFDIYAYPEIKSDGTKIKIGVKSKEDYAFDEIETEFNSSGYKAFYQLMLNLENAKYYVKNKNQKVIILADEPDKNLHPLLQQQLSDYLTDFAKNNPYIYLVITTHSPFLLKDLQNNFYITERTDSFTESGKKEGSTIFTHFEAKMNNEIGKFKNLYTLLVASELYSNEETLFSNLSEKYVIYVKGTEAARKLKNDLNKLKITDIKVRPLSHISDNNKIFTNDTIYKYFSRATAINDLINIRQELEKGKIILFDPEIKKKKIHNFDNTIEPKLNVQKDFNLHEQIDS